MRYVPTRSAMLRIATTTALTVALFTPASLSARAPAPAKAIPASVPAPQVLPVEIQAILLKSTLTALNQANLTDDYTVLLKLSAVGFQKANSAAQLEAGFASFRQARVDLSPIVLFQPMLTAAPVIQNGSVRLVGVFPTKPQAVKFDIGYIFEGGSWRVASLSAGLAAAAPGS